MTATGATSPIRNVSDTALWVAVYRAMESERDDALFQDPYARMLAAERGQAIVRSMQGSAGAWPMIVRTKLIDDLVMQSVDRGVRTVLNLAAGLDARPYRLALPRTLRWIHADMPDMTAYFQSRMEHETPRCQLEFAPVDLRHTEARQALLARAAGDGPVMVISEGLLIYLDSEHASALARDLRKVAGAAYWVADIATPHLREMFKRQNKLQALERGNAAMKFFPENGAAFFAPHGWRETEFHSIWEASLRFNRTIRGGRFYRWLMRLQPASQREAMRRMTGVVLMQASLAA